MFNAESTLTRSIKTVQQQTFTAWELLVANDGSTDSSEVLAQRLAREDPRIRVISLPSNSGAAAARNYALEHTQGRYIAFLDADDFWHPEKLTRQLNFMKKTTAAISFTAYSRMAETGAQVEEVRAQSKLTYRQLLRRNVMGCLTVVYDSDAIGKCPMPLLTRQQDYALWLKIVRSVGRAHGLDEVLAIYRVGRGTLSANKVAAAQDIWRIYRGQEQLGLPNALWYFARYAFYGLRHRLLQRPAKNASMTDTAFGRTE